MPPRTRPPENQIRETPLPTPAIDQIAPPGKLSDEDRDSAVTGATRSLRRRLLGLGVLKQPAGKKRAPKKEPIQPAGDTAI